MLRTRLQRLAAEAGGSRDEETALVLEKQGERKTHLRPSYDQLNNANIGIGYRLMQMKLCIKWFLTGTPKVISNHYNTFKAIAMCGQLDISAPF